MPRQARKESGTGMYHVMMRGINHQTIFEDEEDNYQFINTLDRMRVRTSSSTPSTACVLGTMTKGTPAEATAHITPTALWATTFTCSFVSAKRV